MYPLHETVLKLVREERALTSKVIEGLQKVSDQKLYLKMGYPTLFSYCTGALGYSEACAYRRIAAVRISQEMPEIKEKIDNGSLSLTTISMAQTLFKKESLSPATKRDVINKIENKSKFETEKILLDYTTDKKLFHPKEKLKMVSPTDTQIQLTVNNEIIRKLNRIKALRSHKNPNMTLESLINDMCDLVLKKLDPAFKKNKKQDDSKSSDINGQKSKYLNYIPGSLKTEVWMRDQGQCTYIDKKSKKRCQAQHFLEFDHIEPLSVGGRTTLKNLRLLCRGHNQLRNYENKIFKGEHLQ